MIESIQKVIKVGSSAAVTIPAKIMKQEHVSVGDEVRVTIERVKPADDIMQDYAKFKKQYSQALKNLASR